MGAQLLLLARKNGDLLLRQQGSTHRVCTVLDACALLGRSRRQVYRYIKEGKLRSRAKLLGEWLLDRDSVAHLHQILEGRVPGFLQPLFPQYRVQDLHVRRDRRLILERVLQSGNLRDLSWVWHSYTEDELRGFVEEEGGRSLSQRNRAFWRIVLGMPPQANSSSEPRKPSNPWTEEHP